MRYHILFENKIDYIVSNFSDKILAAAKKNERNKNLTIDEIMNQLVLADPTPNQVYLNWIARNYYKGLFRLEDTPRIKAFLTQYNSIKHKLPVEQRDINRFNISQVEDIVDSIFKKEIDLTPVKLEGLKAEVLYDGPLGQLAVPLDIKASCILGSGTKWCTAATDSWNAFSGYNRPNNRLYIWRDRSGEKFQFYWNGKSLDVQLMDARDNEISKEQFNKFIEHPVVGILFRKQFIKFISDMSKNYDSFSYLVIDIYDSIPNYVMTSPLQDDILKAIINLIPGTLLKDIPEYYDDTDIIEIGFAKFNKLATSITQTTNVMYMLNIYTQEDVQVLIQCLTLLKSKNRIQFLLDYLYNVLMPDFSGSYALKTALTWVLENIAPNDIINHSDFLEIIQEAIDLKINISPELKTKYLEEIADSSSLKKLLHINMGSEISKIITSDHMAHYFNDLINNYKLTNDWKYIPLTKSMTRDQIRLVATIIHFGLSKLPIHNKSKDKFTKYILKWLNSTVYSETQWFQTILLTHKNTEQRVLAITNKLKYK